MVKKHGRIFILFFRRILSFVLMLISIVLFGLFLAGLEVRLWAVDCEVSQVFKLTRSIHVAGENYAGFYNVAVTPLTAANKMAQVCQLFTVTPSSYLNLLDKKVWLLPLNEYQFAYFETNNTKHLLFLILGMGLALLVVSYLLFQDKD